LSLNDLPIPPNQQTSGIYPTPGSNDPDPQPLDYTPTDDERRLIDEINDKAQRWRKDRQPHEQQWFINAAFFRGQQYVQWSDKDQRLSVPPAPSHRVRLVVNRIFPKVRARIAKFLKNRAVPHVVPAQEDQQAKMNARASERALHYQWRRLHLESKYKDALLWAKDSAKAIWWIYWDTNAVGRVATKNPLTGETTSQDAVIGDVGVEVGSAFELLVADPGISRIGDQSAIMRIKLRPVDDVKGRYPEYANYLKADAGDSDMFRFERQIASLNNIGYGGTGLVESRSKNLKSGQPTLVLVKEYFERPCGTYPQGRYAVVVGDVLVRNEQALPYGFADLTNPYPCVAFSDVETAGQFWGPTVTEQLIGLQREYNLVRSKVAEQLRMMAFPKLLAAKQHQIPDGAWTSEAGEFVEYVAIPGVPPPTPWNPPNIAQDAWQSINLLQREFDDITQVYPASEGNAGQATSGFQTNLLQEATDSVHQPDRQAHEFALEEAAIKIRRLMKLGYDVPRLITTIGHNYTPEVMEFSSDNIDEAALIVVESSSQLPDLKGAKIQAILELFNAGILGDVNDPDVKRRALSMLEMGELETAYDYARRDEDLARIENHNLETNGQISNPEFFQNHNIHYQVHTDQLKNASTMSWPQQQRLQLITHVIWHVDFMNPASALQLSQQYGIQPPPHAMQLLQQQQMMQQQQALHPGMPPPPGPPPGPQVMPHPAASPPALGGHPMHPQAVHPSAQAPGPTPGLTPNQPPTTLSPGT
jgi:hypothetical protein